MADYDSGSTGVGKLHISFAKPDDLVTTSNVEMPQLGHKYQPKRTHKSNLQQYDDFKYQMDKLLNGRKRINNDDYNRCLSKVSHALGKKVVTLKTAVYTGHYLKESNITIVNFHDQRHWQYLKDYAVFKTERDKCPNAYGKELAQLRKRVSAKTGIGEMTLKGQKYEYKWRSEHDD